ncbi:succinate-semialdehyde dehydrogenase/glutarate-semialdehyde dehydrogenase [Paraperlucidibaca baekdonensis]|uniref:Succinate-semialdehyde dehydrogenase/glutarate-semialdehyde dehydrogenase n=1 Tax=Paraperlucidibaca baekdonensis TaxID=748120 RepID=A0A3E0H4W8_9GAMM|nr:NAD-dependent succinate-semialdehyde dehydrogenase [Paraperlucidibaca baekdonensis]REH37680.1 succinate-semialdehyde dehydrogenase/glutarate-semialdehyde dehydrogenase [Paraperlucidibaca baekdonensis]
MAFTNPLLRQQAFINGQWLSADSGATHAIDNPATGEIIAQVPDMGASETAQAIAAAERALPAWRALPAKSRSQILKRWFDLIISHQEDLAQLMTAEQGKPLAESRGEVAYGASFIEWFAEEGKRAYGDVIPGPTPDRRLIALKQPIGVTAAITPWNFPIAMITRKVAPALAVGCTSVVKPAEATPLCALALAYLAQQAGLPDGVFNVITTAHAASVGDVLTQSPVVRKLSFTGSTAVGKKLMAACADTVKRVSLELGGNAPFIVLEDADLDAAVQGALASKYRNAGQTCVCANRFLVHDSIYDAFAAKLQAAVAKFVVGDGTDEHTTIGPLINAAAVDKVERLVNDSIAAGATLAMGGARHARGGNFYQPTVLLEVDNAMPIAQQESFGPVAPLIRVRDADHAVALANATQAGLAAYLYGRDLKQIWSVAERLEYGMVGINEGIISNEMAPFGGVKESGLGREGSKYGLDEYLETQYLCLGGMNER